MNIQSHHIQAAAYGTMGALHMIKPQPFDAIVPAVVPGTPRFWTYASGVAELGVAGLIANPRTRELGGKATVALLLTVWPANFEMARQALKGENTRRKVITVLRLPLQIPLMKAAAALR